ncbi:MAG: hypothetical protein KGK01_14090 [Bradyrhizobium sp.]|uniref:hypothetical protein n=1 Tax=Bradyrhizobium sp. TaxID=376 RepID=UPI001C28AB7E|nr:hypothetical protein [Bradyrhizobium sp.]MBU6464725.1 hypothetical protein [Pseudomonadota bacterium]MDE2068679.1 hypothetical protein [Bradyrhizobium sp.]MDE2243509.1 hypothetical protein [Bradyrhizobium sp.]MDE2469306.1 hypothetical protein [Bradyrhizobium sp.]
MSGSDTTAILRSVLDEICRTVGRYENGIRTHVAAKLLEAAAQGPQSIDELREAGREALRGVPTMWR